MSDPTEITATEPADSTNRADDTRTNAPQEGTEGEPQGKPEPTPEEKAQAEKDRQQRRWDRKTAELRRTERERDELRGRLSALEERQPSQRQTQANPDRQPNPRDYSDDGEYFRAGGQEAYERDMRAWDQRRIDKAVDERLSARDQKTQGQALTDKVNASLRAMETADPTFADRITDLLDDMPTLGKSAGYQAVAQAENPGAVLDYLTKNHAEAEKLAGMTEAQALRHIGRIEDRIDAAKAATANNSKPAPGANLPTPPTPVGGRSAPVEVDGSKLTDKQWEERELAKQRQQRGSERRAGQR